MKMEYKNYQKEIVRVKKIANNIKTFIDKGDNGAVWNCLTDLELCSKWLWEQYDEDMAYKRNRD